MREAALIDLGADWEVGDPDGDRRPADPVRRRRTGLAGLLAALVATTLIGAAPNPHDPPVRELALLPYPGQRSAIAIAGDLIVVSHSGGELTAYRHDGTRAWHVKLEDLLSVVSIHRIGGLILVTADRGLESSVATVALDPLTGEQVWRRPGAAAVTSEAVLLSYGEWELTALDPVGLDPLWRLADVIAHAPFGSNLLVLHKNGDIEERELRTGTLLRANKLVLPNNFRARLTLVPDRVIVSESGLGLGRERHFWVDSRTLAPTTPGPAWVEWRDCGAVWCGRARGSSRFSMVDKQTGEAWLLPEGQLAAGTPAGLLTMAYRTDDTFSAIGIVDPRTGRTLLAMGGWHTVAVNSSDFGELAPYLVWPVNSGSHIARLSRGGLRVLGRVPHEVLGCRNEETLLLCWTTEGKIGLWRPNLS